MRNETRIGITRTCKYVCDRYPESVGVVYWEMDNDLVVLCGVSIKGQPASDVVIYNASDEPVDEEKIDEAARVFRNPALAVEKATELGICFLNAKIRHNAIKDTIFSAVFGKRKDAECCVI